MTKIILSTESGADIPTDLAQVYNFKIIPMHVIMEGTDYLDGSLPVEKIYDYYRRTKKIPSTTSTNTYEYMDFFLESKGIIQIVSLFISAIHQGLHRLSRTQCWLLKILRIFS